MTPPVYWQEAVAALTARDPVMRELISRYANVALATRGDAFATLARSIVGQQISVRAAQAIWDRLSARFAPLTPAALALARQPALRACGLSGRKAVYLRDLARRFRSRALDPESWHALDDESLIGQLTQVNGIGRWTAEMFLIFYLTRPDVLPLADIGLQRAMRIHYNRGRTMSPARMRRVAAAWAPWRSVATWYLWRSLDPLPVEY